MISTDKSVNLCQRIKNEFRRFCLKTSIRGVSRILNTKHQLFRLIWLLFVIGTLIGCLSTIVLLSMQFLERNVIQQRTLKYNIHSPFPSATFCNMRPFSSYGAYLMKKHTIPSWAKFMSDYVGVLLKQARHSIDNLNKVNSLQLFLLNLPPDLKASELLHHRFSTVVTCQVTFNDGSEKSCDSMGFWNDHYNELYGRCFTYTVNDNFTKKAKDIQMLINLDLATSELMCKDCGPIEEVDTKMRGLSLLIHESSTYPSVDHDSVVLLPNTLSHYAFQSMKYSILQPPYGECNSTMKTLDEFFPGIKYTQSLCNHLMKQKILAEKCDCVSVPGVPVSLMKYHKENKICGFFKFPTWPFGKDIVSKIRLANKTGACYKKILSENYSKLCPLPCEYYRYDERLRTGPYPIKSNNLQYYRNLRDKLIINFKENKQVIKNKESLKAFEFITNKTLKELSVYDEITKLAKVSRPKMLEKFRNTRVIEDNFLTFKISRRNFDLQTYTDKPVISATAFTSQIGGMLSLWSGITFICLAEIIELILRVLYTCKTDNSAQVNG